MCLVVALAAISAFGLSGCGEKNESVESSTYKQLPPGEGQRRLQETLKRRSTGQLGNQSTNQPGTGSPR